MAAIAALIVVMALMSGRKTSEIELHMDSYNPAASPTAKKGGIFEGFLEGFNKSLTRNKGGRTSRLTEELAKADLKLRVSESVMLIVGLILLLCAVLFLRFHNPVLALAGIPAGYVVAGFFCKFRLRRRLRAVHDPGADPYPGRDSHPDGPGARLRLHHHRAAVRAGPDPDLHLTQLYHPVVPRMAWLRPDRDGPGLDRHRLRHHLENHKHPGVANEHFHYRLRLPGLQRCLHRHPGRYRQAAPGPDCRTAGAVSRSQLDPRRDRALAAVQRALHQASSRAVGQPAHRPHGEEPAGRP